MKERDTVFGGVTSAVAVALVVGSVTDTPTLLAQTPAGISIYLVLALGVPQLVLGKETSDPIRLGLGTLSMLAGGLVVLMWPAFATVGPGFLTVLLLVVLGSLGGAAIGAFRRGYTGPEKASQ